ncbi:MAG: HupE/UreJ family protein [Flavitalea sp.]
MGEFWLYFGLGKDHIADLNGYDHILFVAALCLGYLLRDWKKILILVTAFTIGHSITLALSALNIVTVSIKWVEFLIPVTIVLTALFNTRSLNGFENRNMKVVYALTTFFGLIHGLGFSNYLKSLLGKDSSIFSQLLAFNLGLEAGQIIIVAIILLLSVICVRGLGIDRRNFILFSSGAIFGIALLMAIERFPL